MNTLQTEKKIVVPIAYIKSKNLTPTEQLLLDMLLRRCDIKTSLSQISQTELSELMNVSFQTVSVLIRKFKHKEIIAKTLKVSETGKKGTCNQYQLNLKRILG